MTEVPEVPKLGQLLASGGKNHNLLLLSHSKKHTLELPDWWIFLRTSHLIGLFSVPLYPFGPLGIDPKPLQFGGSLNTQSRPLTAPSA